MTWWLQQELWPGSSLGSDMACFCLCPGLHREDRNRTWVSSTSPEPIQHLFSGSQRVVPETKLLLAWP